MAMVANRPATAVGDQRVVLRKVSWRTYEGLLADHPDRSAPRLTYDHGVLEIMSPSTPHEVANRTLALLVEIVAEELGIEVHDVGSMTFKRDDLQHGFEPDSTFYVQSEDAVSGKAQIDLVVDPPPDLVIEIEVSQPALDKLPLFAAAGVAEVWRGGATEVRVLRLGADGYTTSETSAALPPLTAEALSEFLVASRTLKRTAWLRSIRAWVRERTAAG